MLQDLASRMQEQGDLTSVGKLHEQERKRAGDRLSLAFCGHFSAGKSTLINWLCGHPLLPSSPIPTSANIVTIRSGEAKATVLRQGGAGLVQQEVALNEVEEACRNGDAVQAVELYYPIPLLGEHGELLDTPGVDSTDEAHMRATESALHLADVVFYVMDYNHVLSELNFSFVKRLKEIGKPVYLVVNQIDKHREQELPFPSYAEGVRRAFADWGIPFDGILYVSMKVPHHPYQESAKLIWLIRRLIEQRGPLLHRSAVVSARQIVAEHLQVVVAEHQDERERLQQASADGEAALVRYREAEQERERLREEPESMGRTWQLACQHILDNANITPAATRDLAQTYLESRSPGFKVGLFGSKAKTEAEREQRLQALQASFSEQVRAHVVWHLQAELKRAAEAADLPVAVIEASLAEMEAAPSAAWLAEQVAPGAIASGEYTLQYAKQLASETKALYRKRCLAAIRILQDALESRCKERIASLESELEQLNRELQAFRELEQLERSEREYAASLNGMVTDQGGIGEEELLLPDMTAYVPEKIGQAEAAAQAAAPVEQGAALAEAALLAIGDSAGESTATRDISVHRTRSADLARRLREAAALIADLPGLQSSKAALQEKADKLEANRFTVALFGAFSAGKSSFANALIGERLLPVSPNPTTAAINTIVPPSADRENGTALVRFKREPALRDEIRHSVSLLGFAEGEAERLPALLAELKPEHLSPAAGPHLSFLQAVSQGWERMRDRFGSELLIGPGEFATYAADEATSCFVESIELHYAHPLAEQGVILVDTPGADSIHARHTGVAFNYMKNADAILFVTYYNHAFSQADREFLLQLGRVKDAFELDKMFFLVNAADLAASREELDDVCTHVEANLLRHGIRHPRLYPVSSREAVEAKLAGNREQLTRSGFAGFEADFHRFVFEELGGISLRAAEAELANAIRRIDDYRRLAEAGEEARAEAGRVLESGGQEALRLLSLAEGESERKELDTEVRELLFYVKQRIGFRFGEWYNLAFNPSSLREDGRDIRAALRSAWTELLRLLSVGLSQEVLATTLRADRAVQLLADRRHEQLATRIADRLSDFSAEAPPVYPDPGTPEVREELAPPALDFKQLYAAFRNGRSFFEGDGKAKLREQLEPLLVSAVAAYCEQHAEALSAYYQKLYDSFEESGRRQLALLVQEHLERQRSALQQTVDLRRLEAIRGTLVNLSSS